MENKINVPNPPTSSWFTHKKNMIYMVNHHFPMVFRVFPYVCTILHFEFSLVVPASCPKAPRPTSFLPNDLRVFVFLRRHGQIHGITWWPSGGKVAMWAPGNRINISIYNNIYIYTFKIINHYTPYTYIYIKSYKPLNIYIYSIKSYKPL